MLKIRGMSISGNLLMGVNRFGHGLTLFIWIGVNITNTALLSA
jgi:hypothetical protein